MSEKGRVNIREFKVDKTKWKNKYNKANLFTYIKYHCNITQEPNKSKFLWKLPLMATLPSMVSFMQREQGTYQGISLGMHALRHNWDGSWTLKIYISIVGRFHYETDKVSISIYRYYLAIRFSFHKTIKENKQRKDFQEINQRVIWIAYCIACWNHVRINFVLCNFPS